MTSLPPLIFDFLTKACHETPVAETKTRIVCEMCALFAWLQKFSMRFPILPAILLILSVFQPRSQAYSLSVHANTLHQVNLMVDTNDYLVLPYTSATVDGRNGAPVDMENLPFC